MGVEGHSLWSASELAGHKRPVCLEEIPRPSTYPMACHSCKWPQLPLTLDHHASSSTHSSKQCTPEKTPWKINMEPQNQSLEDDFPFHFGMIFRFQPLYLGGVPQSNKNKSENCTEASRAGQIIIALVDFSEAISVPFVLDSRRYLL